MFDFRFSNAQYWIARRNVFALIFDIPVFEPYQSLILSLIVCNGEHLFIWHYFSDQLQLSAIAFRKRKLNACKTMTRKKDWNLPTFTAWFSINTFNFSVSELRRHDIKKWRLWTIFYHFWNSSHFGTKLIAQRQRLFWIEFAKCQQWRSILQKNSC